MVLDLLLLDRKYLVHACLKNTPKIGWPLFLPRHAKTSQNISKHVRRCKRLLNAATTKAGEESEAEGAKALAENMGSEAPPTNLNSLIFKNLARALAPAPAPKIATVNLRPPDPGKSGASKRVSWPPEAGGAEATCTGIKSLNAS